MKLSTLRVGTKLVLINVLSALFVLALCGGLLLYQTWAQNQKVFEKRIVQQGQLIAMNITAALVFEDWDAATEILGSLRTDPAVRGAVLMGTEGQPLVHFRPERQGDISRVDLSVIVPVKDQGSEIGEIVLHAYNGEVKSAALKALASILTLTLIALLLGVVLSTRTQRIVTLPILRLSAFTRRVRDTKNYGLRMDPVYSDEVGALTDDLNAMMNIIQERDSDLERKVEERTDALRRQNAELQSEIQERERAERERQASEARFEKAFRNAPIGMAMVDGEGSVLQHNDMLRAVLHIEEDTSCNLAEHILGDDHAEFSRHLSDLACSRQEFAQWEADCRSGAGVQLHCVLALSAIRDEQQRFLYCVLQIQDVTESRRLAEELRYQASHDELTGLANRRVLEEELGSFGRRCSGDTPLALLLMDLDQFKIVNDSCGHSAGDDLLVQVGQLLTDSIRKDDLAVRMGGDEFAVLLIGCGQDQARVVAEKIRVRIEEFVFECDSQIFRIGASIGLNVVQHSFDDPAELIKAADAACFAAKERGRNQVVVVADDSNEVERRTSETRWVQRIRRAMTSDDFVLFCQPVVGLNRSDEFERLEILLRLRNRETGTLIPPGAFIPAAERYDLSVKLDEWVINNLIRTLKTYKFLFDDNRNYWVNLSGRSIGDARFLKFLEEAIVAAALPPGVLNFEITETAVIRNIAQAADIMSRIRDLGCRFALDDFGSGLSSFAYLRTLPVDYIKIDGMFVRDIVTDVVDRMFVKSIIDIAKAMHISSVVEFVESDAIRDLVTELGADYGQGFALGRPRELLPAGVLANECEEQAVGQ